MDVDTIKGVAQVSALFSDEVFFLYNMHFDYFITSCSFW